MLKIENKNKNIEFVIELIYIGIGAFLIAIGINLFLLPNKMTTGGASGIATIIFYILNIPMGITTILLNLPLIIISIIKLGKQFTIKTIISTLLLSVFLDVFKMEEFAKSLELDLLLACILGGITVGIGLSLTFRADASSGGSDLLANIIYKTKNVESISQLLLVIEVIIISATIFVFKNVNIGVYSLLAMVISTKVIDIVFEGIYYTKVATIITDKKDKIIDKILYELKRGATIIDAKGALTYSHKYIITCVIARNQVPKIKQIVKDEDKNAIMYFTSANEALGFGFKSLS